MSRARLRTQPVILEHRAPGTADRYRDTSDMVTDTVDVLVYLEQRTSTEVPIAGDLVAADWYADLPPGTPIGPYDTLLVDGARFEVVGHPNRIRNPRTRREVAVEALLRYIEGVRA